MPPIAVWRLPASAVVLAPVRRFALRTALTVRRNMKWQATIHSNLARSLERLASILSFMMTEQEHLKSHAWKVNTFLRLEAARAHMTNSNTEPRIRSATASVFL